MAVMVVITHKVVVVEGRRREEEREDGVEGGRGGREGGEGSRGDGKDTRGGLAGDSLRTTKGLALIEGDSDSFRLILAWVLKGLV